MKLDLEKFDDVSLVQLVEARWLSSSELWETVEKIYKQNTAIYENKSQWLNMIPQRRNPYRVQANRVFVNMEAVINSLIARPPGINILPGKKGLPAQEKARKLESYFRKKYTDLNLKETVRMGLRNLYFGRLIVIKPFWNPKINDFDFRAIDPRKVRVGKYARKEPDTEFAIEEIEDNLCAVIERFPKKKEDLMKKYGFYGEDGETQMYIKNPDVTYKEAWIQDYVIFKLDNIILDKIRNPYWDWEGIKVTEEELLQLEGDGTPNNPGLEGEQRRQFLMQIKLQQEQRETPETIEGGENETEANPDGAVSPQGELTTQYKTYYYNYFDFPRKPFIFGTIFNNENTPIGRTDMITLSAELQRGIDKRKMDIDENAELVNGMLKVDASVMPKTDAQRIRFETKGVIWGKGVKDGVTREHGTPLPAFVHEDMLDSRSEIDNIMAASSAFRGEREGQETKAGRLALIQQSYLRLNELVQLTDYIAQEMFCWSMQMAKTRYTEYHTAELANKEGDRESIELIQDDIETGHKVTIIAGKSLPVDDEFKFEQAQGDVEKGYISPVDYLEIAQYDNSKDLSKNAVAYKINPIVAVGMTPEEASKLAPPDKTEEKPPNVTINFADVPIDGKAQILEKIGVHVNPAIMVAEKMKEHADKKAEGDAKVEAMRSKQNQHAVQK